MTQEEFDIDMLEQELYCMLCTNTIKSDRGCDGNCNVNKRLYESIIGIVRKLRNMEERKTGKWINAYPDIEPNPMFMYGICSVCGFEQSISNKLNYCPNCGAEMETEE